MKRPLLPEDGDDEHVQNSSSKTVRHDSRSASISTAGDASKSTGQSNWTVVPWGHATVPEPTQEIHFMDHFSPHRNKVDSLWESSQVKAEGPTRRLWSPILPSSDSAASSSSTKSDSTRTDKIHQNEHQKRPRLSSNEEKEGDDSLESPVSKSPSDVTIEDRIHQTDSTTFHVYCAHVPAVYKTLTTNTMPPHDHNGIMNLLDHIHAQLMTLIHHVPHPMPGHLEMNAGRVGLNRHQNDAATHSVKSILDQCVHSLWSVLLSTENKSMTRENQPSLNHSNHQRGHQATAEEWEVILHHRLMSLYVPWCQQEFLPMLKYLEERNQRRQKRFTDGRMYSSATDNGMDELSHETRAKRRTMDET